MKKWLVGSVSSVFIIAALVSFRDNLYAVWNTPEKTRKIEDVLSKQQESTERLTDLVEKQEAELDKTQEVQAVQIEALQKQLELIAELKKWNKGTK